MGRASLDDIATYLTIAREGGFTRGPAGANGRRPSLSWWMR